MLHVFASEAFGWIRRGGNIWPAGGTPPRVRLYSPDNAVLRMIQK
jgi:hypothetical protein